MEPEVVHSSNQIFKDLALVYKEYVLPSIIPIFGAFVAYGVFWLKEVFDLEKSKLNIINDWSLKIDGALNNLIQIKSNYYEKLTPDPIERMVKMPYIVHTGTPLVDDISNLVFIVTKKKPNDNIDKWEDIIRVRIMIGNYNMLLTLLNTRNQLAIPFFESMVKRNTGEGYAILPTTAIIDQTDKPFLMQFIQLTEKILILVDDLIVEMTDFLNKFPNTATKKMKTNPLTEKHIYKMYGSILNFSDEGKSKRLELIKKSVKGDYDSIQQLFGRSTATLEHMFRSGYEEE